MALDYGRSVGQSCSTCPDFGRQGSIRQGLKATVIGTVKDVNEKNPTISVTQVLPHTTPCPNGMTPPANCPSGMTTTKKTTTTTRMTVMTTPRFPPQCARSSLFDGCQVEVPNTGTLHWQTNQEAKTVKITLQLKNPSSVWMAVTFPTTPGLMVPANGVISVNSNKPEEYVLTKYSTAGVVKQAWSDGTIRGFARTNSGTAQMTFEVPMVHECVCKSSANNLCSACSRKWM